MDKDHFLTEMYPAAARIFCACYTNYNSERAIEVYGNSNKNVNPLLFLKSLTASPA